MSLVGRFFGKRGRPGDKSAGGQILADRQRAAMFSAPDIQTDAERDGVRTRMETELADQRERRLQA